MTVNTFLLQEFELAEKMGKQIRVREHSYRGYAVVCFHRLSLVRGSCLSLRYLSVRINYARQLLREMKH